VIKGVWPLGVGKRQGVLDGVVWDDLKQRVFSKNLAVVQVFIAEGLTEDMLGELGGIVIVTPYFTNS
jgi:hypothetical protein